MDFKTMQQAAGLQKKISKVKEDLENTHIEAEHKGLVITFNWGMNIIGIEFESDEVVWNKVLIAEAIQTCFNKASVKSQEISVEKMGELMKGSGINPKDLGM